MLKACAGEQYAWLSWNIANTNQNVISYNVFYGTQSGVYDMSDTSYYPNGDMIFGLEEGTTYYFVVQAVDVNGNKSALSSEYAYTVPTPTSPPLKVQRLTNSDGTPFMRVTASWDTPTDWDLDASTDMQYWYPIMIGHGSDCSDDVNFGLGDKIYFRLVLY